ncbi:transporter substrate-binding domain-containing protein [Raoultibacter timonensis]|uniref:Amino acid ABC transporter substrate-binding protein n=1 Tax=Raoultibacter timonensis TaxID=1907662 RepID=A0ABM7WGS2_9ACTN|nr:transporter substrate-binding domain-containing protein [Raoultibacter timonensis]BDE95426.1 amino acid ABC transporter substrate-binding protein [Raoultibacter timonensis]BDF50029.1 amino acid ABC transporter substrate-binding protein [Raoultibacter timonensis]
MKKKLLAILSAACVLCLSAVLLAGCSGGDSAQKSEGGDAAGSDAFTLTVGFDQSYPPYGFVGDDGNFTGIDLDMAKEVCERNGWELKLEPIDWEAKDALLDSGGINCIWNGFTMEGREDGYLFSEPYMLNEQVVVVKADSDIKSLDDLADKTLITQVDSAALDVLSDEENEDMVALKGSLKELQTIGDYNNAFMQLESGMVDAVACDLSIAAYQMAAKPDAYVQLDPLSTEHYAVGFKKGETELADKVTETLKAMYEDGTIKELCDKYAEYGVSYDNWVLR